MRALLRVKKIRELLHMDTTVEHRFSTHLMMYEQAGKKYRKLRLIVPVA